MLGFESTMKILLRISSCLCYNWYTHIHKKMKMCPKAPSFFVTFRAYKRAYESGEMRRVGGCRDYCGIALINHILTSPFKFVRIGQVRDGVGPRSRKKFNTETGISWSQN